MTRGLRAAMMALALIPALAGAQSANLYRRLASAGLDPARVYLVRDARLDREDLHLALSRGTIAFLQAVDGRITGAFFEGDGEVLLSPPDHAERASLGLFTGAAILNEKFTSAYFRFNDDTCAELQPSLRPFQAPPPLPDDTLDGEPGPQQNAKAATPQEFLNEWDGTAHTLAPVAALRLLVTFADAESITPDGSLRWTQPAGDRLLFARLGGTRQGIIDAYFDSRSPEQIRIAHFATAGGASYYDIWTSFPMHSARARVLASSSGARLSATVQTQTAAEAVADDVLVHRYLIHARIHPPRELEADATLELETSAPGHRILLFELSRFLRVKTVELDGSAIEFVQNEALEGSELARRGNDLVAVVFPAPLTPQRRVHLRFTYAGDVLSEAGGGLLYVGARGIWYPNRGLAMSDFDMEFRYPAPWTLLATGKRTKSSPAESAADGAEQVAHYVTEHPIPVAGFNLGRYVRAEAKSGKVVVETYAARGMERSFPRQQEVIVTPEAADRVSARTGHEMRVIPVAPPEPSQHAQDLARQTAHFVDFMAARFGPFPYGSLALTQMPGRASQGWPGLIYLSSYAFLDQKERAQAHLSSFEDLLYGRLMTPHETAHQWWGDLLIWNSYREQWLVEALSNYSVLLMLEQQNPAAVRAVLAEYRRQLIEPANEARKLGGLPSSLPLGGTLSFPTSSGGPPLSSPASERQGGGEARIVSDAGPVTLGVRLNSSLFPEAYETIAYGRGTWLFHMLRHLLVDGSVAQSPSAALARDDPFVVVLHTLRQRFEGKSITTRDVQQAFEDALPDYLRYEGRKSLDWFFDGWVNGTAVPQLELDNVKLTHRGAALIATGRIRQKHAPNELVTSVPLYALTAAAKPVWLGRVFAEGPDTPFRLPAPPGTHKLLLDPYQTILTRP